MKIGRIGPTRRRGFTWAADNGADGGRKTTRVKSKAMLGSYRWRSLPLFWGIMGIPGIFQIFGAKSSTPRELNTDIGE
jgi:hypothetical protein